MTWRSTDALYDTALPIGTIDLAVSCVGNMRPAPTWEEFFGLHWDDDAMRRENGEITARIAEAAKRAGAKRFAYVSVCSASKWAYGGALMGYIDGKEEGEKAVLRLYGDDNSCFVGPSLMYGGERFSAFGKVYAAVGASPPLRAQTKFFKALKQLAASGYQPADAVGEVATLPPADVSAVATAVAAGLLGTVPESMRQAHADQQRYEAQIRLKAGLPEEPIYTTLYMDGTEQINEVARSEAGAPATLAAAVQAMERDATGTDADAVVTMPASAAPVGADDAPLQSPSAFGKPFEGATMGWKPFLWPWPPGIALVGFFAGAILANQNGLSS